MYSMSMCHTQCISITATINASNNLFSIQPCEPKALNAANAIATQERHKTKSVITKQPRHQSRTILTASTTKIHPVPFQNPIPMDITDARDRHSRSRTRLQPAHRANRRSRFREQRGAGLRFRGPEKAEIAGSCSDGDGYERVGGTRRQRREGLVLAREAACRAAGRGPGCGHAGL